MVSSIRFGGMASGLDTEKIVKELMNAERAPLNRLLKNKQLQEWKRDSYREMNSMLLDFQKSLDSLRFTTNFDKKKAVSDNDSAVTVKTNGKPTLSNYSIKVNQVATAAVPASTSLTPTLANSTTKFTSDFSFEITAGGNTSTINVTTDDTLDSVIRQINQSSSGVKATYFNNQLVLTNSDGTTFDLNVTSGSGAELGLGSTKLTSSAGTPGKDAIVEINGVSHTLKGNTFTYDGMEFTVKQTTVSPVNVSVKADEDAVFNAISNFVTKYNEVIDKVNAKTSEKKNKGYEPLLDEDREKLSETVAEKMENMAKSGILQRDSTLTSVLNSMRFALTNPLKGADASFDTLSEIGITGATNSKYAYLDKGKLYIDETKLREAINKNGEKVVQLFTQYSSNKDANETGLAQRMYDELNKTIKLLSSKAGNSTAAVDDSEIGKNLSRISDDINSWQDRLKKTEDRYWKQFTAMETALSKYNSQSSWFTNMSSGQ
ncbi:flagellar filament capping protein FliD [Brevibacillus choshinensis]|uniref:flagellar filament capping protein FliD n=1 Tax=Brevibacillus choshinensis TaxID=54911 RepID=UPI002E1E8519|nr:flagellar filament capping protein FliD [Brevibacillus choshinensis]MED4754667.1 flagellar filament capping protein FliD [Brevibacillus choshinensis]